MRQVGYLAAAGKYALENHVNRLSEDHVRARVIGDSLQKMDYVENLRPVETNIVLFDIKPTRYCLRSFKDLLETNNVKASFMGDNTVRFVTHLHFCDRQLENLINVLRKLN